MFLAIFLILGVAFVQRYEGSGLVQKNSNAAAVEPPDVQFEITAKMYAKFQRAFGDKKLAEQALTALDDLAKLSKEPADRMRAAIYAGEFVSAEEAGRRLDAMEPEIVPGTPLEEDFKALADIYDAGEKPSPETAARLKKHHGFFGELAATHHLPANDPAREELLGGGLLLLFLLLIIGFGLLAALIAGTVILVVMWVRASSGRLRPAFVPPAPGGSMAIEVVAVFALGFLVLVKGLSSVLGSSVSSIEAVWITLAAQWALLAVFLWPRLMGAPRGRRMALLGWHRGEGVLKEIGCGVVGYLACVPLLVGAAVVSLILTLIEGYIRQHVFHQAPKPPENPILEIVGGKAGPLLLVMIFLLASLWAPIVEETVFRGGLYRQLRSGWRVFPAALVTAVCFGIMHAYPIRMLGPVIALGFGFAMMREWRGSLIAPMTAHCLHNATVLGLLLFAMRLMG